MPGWEKVPRELKKSREIGNKITKELKKWNIIEINYLKNGVQSQWSWERANA